MVSDMTEKQQMSDYFHLKQTFYMRCFENTGKIKKKKKKKWIRIGHGIRHD